MNSSLLEARNKAGAEKGAQKVANVVLEDTVPWFLVAALANSFLSLGRGLRQELKQACDPAMLIS